MPPIGLRAAAAAIKRKVAENHSRRSGDQQMRCEARHQHNGWRAPTLFRDVQLAAGLEQALTILMKP